MTAKKCTKKRDARANMLCLINLLLIDVLVAVAVAVVVTKTPKYPPKGRWIVVYIPRREESMYLCSAVHRPWGGSFGIYQISWIKMTKGFFFLSRKFVHNLHGFRGFCQVHFCDLVANWTSVKIIFWPPVNTDKPKFVAFLLFFCTTASFIAQISSSQNFLKRDAISAQ